MQHSFMKKNSALVAHLKSIGIDTDKPFRCLNPDHEDKHPSMSYDFRRDKAHCFACGVTYDLVDVLQLSGMDVSTAIKAKDLFYRENFENGSYWKSRGFLNETILRFQLSEDTYRAAIPLDENYCIFRSKNKKIYFNPKGQQLRLYDPENAEGFVFVVGGAIDAISILQAAEEAGLSCVGAIALNGVSNVLKMALYARPDSIYCLSLDNDEAGRAAQARLASLMSTRNKKYIEYNLYGAFKDANERLVADPSGLASALRDALRVYDESKGNNLGFHDTQQACIAQYAQDAQQEGCRGAKHDDKLSKRLSSSINSSNLGFLNNLFDSPEPRFMATGFKALDGVISGLPRGGLTVLGAPSGAGKTTLCLNITDNAAKAGVCVLFFTLENTRRELMLKSISRETLLSSPKYAVPYGSLMNNFSERAVLDAYEAYSRYAGRIFMIEPEFPSPELVLEAVEGYLRTASEPPLVVIDYLQLLVPGDARFLTDKQMVDRSITMLRRLCRMRSVTVLAVSSLNRSGYSNVSMEAFKESGSIEYSSDLLLALSSSDSCAEVSVLKNRYGPAGARGKLRFYHEYGCFI